MLKIENTEVYGWEAAIRGMRNPMNSWDKSDSGKGCLERRTWSGTEKGILLCENCSATHDSHCVCFGKKQFVVGENDLKLMKSLANAGSDHGKFLRMITVTFDITAPLYWWKEFDTYKVGTVANSCSTMHKIHANQFTMDDFSCEHLMTAHSDCFPLSGIYKGIVTSPLGVMDNIVTVLNECRKRFLETKDKRYWWQMIQLLPSSYNQRRTVQLNYQVLKSMYHARKNHKLDEWHTFCDWVESLPYAAELIVGQDE